ncbi:MAG: glycosyltransferase family A protein [Chlamydiota bacterium]
MKKAALFFLLLCAVFSASFAFARRGILPFGSLRNRTLDCERFDHQFCKAPYPLRNKPFTIIAVGVNNGATVEKTLASVFAQNYENYRLIYIDDASDDGSFEAARGFIQNSPHLHRVEFIRNEERSGFLASLTYGVRTCSDHEIIVVLEGSDWLAHEWVLQRLNAYYADPELWITYGNDRNFPTFQEGKSRPIYLNEWKERGFRGYPFVFSHLNTFYAALFKKIEEADFIYQGKFFQADAPLAYMLPMLEMAEDHFQFIPEVLYINGNLKGGAHELSEIYEKVIRGLNPYQPLSALSFVSEGK